MYPHQYCSKIQYQRQTVFYVFPIDFLKKKTTAMHCGWWLTYSLFSNYVPVSLGVLPDWLSLSILYGWTIWKAWNYLRVTLVPPIDVTSVKYGTHGDMKGQWWPKLRWKVPLLAFGSTSKCPQLWNYKLVNVIIVKMKISIIIKMVIMMMKIDNIYISTQI